ncbi:MAG: Glycosyl hydrolase 38 domain protein [Bacteroidetes bacterium]|nr:Glycosyl hydrolase 38 domain protein [Bacteroidota bacterium]
MNFSRMRSVTFLLFALSFTLVASPQKSGDEIRINIRQEVDPKNPAYVATFLNGYRKSISGQLITYRSSHPDAEVAMLVRARKEAHSISWETDTVPNIYAGDQYRFIWLAGLECEGFQNPHEVHSFDLLVNGERWLTFKNVKDSTAKLWNVKAANGAELSFEATVVDRAGDLFGTMVLNVPRRLVPSGKPLTLQVVGEDAESGDWFMTFQYSFSFEPRIRIEPVLMRETKGESQILRLSLDNLRKGRAIQIFAGSWQLTSKPLEVGSNVFFVLVAAARATKEIPVSFSVNEKPLSRRFVAIKPVNKRDIYILSYSHNDIGYTDLQPNIERKQWRNLDEALRLINLTKEYPPDARYKWNMEVLWALDSYLRQAPESKRREVIDAIRAGSIGLNALYANILTGLANAVEMSHFTEFARTLEWSYTIPITTALVSDIPGFTWGIVPTLAQSGVKYFSISPNPGDRIGFTIEQWGDKPFYWQSQSGKERILTWVAGESYASFHEGDLSKLGDEKVFKLLRKLDDNRYPYEIVQLPYTVGGDNGPPDAKLPDYVKRWNERYSTPRLIIATHDQMFKEFERRYGPTLPAYSGDFTPYWEDGAASSAYETALNRQAADRLIQAEAVWSMRAMASYPDSQFAAAWRNVSLYDEHTWGAHNSISEPDLPFVKDQWAIKQRFALDADSLSKLLLKQALHEAQQIKEERSFDIYNTQSWPRTDIVYLTAEESSVGDMVVSGDGKTIPTQRLSTGELAVMVKDIPPMSARRISVRNGKAVAQGSALAVGSTLKNGVLSLTISKTTGAIDALQWNRNGLQLVDTARGAGLNEYIYVPGKNPADAKRPINVKVTVGEQGKLISSLVVKADAPGCKSYSYEVRVLDGIDRFDIINVFDKEAVRAKEGVHLAFPFSVPDGQLRYDVAHGIVRPEIDQLPGACKNFFSVVGWVDVSNDQRGVTWATIDAPLIEIGAITAEKPWMKEIGPAQNFYSYVMNNYWHTNYKADQEGAVLFRYSVRPHGEYRQEEAARFGIERRQPLVVLRAHEVGTLEGSLYELESDGVLVLSTRPVATGGGWLLYLYNPTPQAQPARLKWNKRIPVSIHVSDGFGKAGEPIEGSFEISAYGSVYVRVNPR